MSGWLKSHWVIILTLVKVFVACFYLLCSIIVAPYITELGIEDGILYWKVFLDDYLVPCLILLSFLPLLTLTYDIVGWMQRIVVVGGQIGSSLVLLAGLLLPQVPGKEVTHLAHLPIDGQTYFLAFRPTTDFGNRMYVFNCPHIFSGCKQVAEIRHEAVDRAYAKETLETAQLIAGLGPHSFTVLLEGTQVYSQ